jgi:hypothetical protein
VQKPPVAAHSPGQVLKEFAMTAHTARYAQPLRNALAFAALTTSLAAQAALPTVDVSFTQSSGVVGPTDVIEVWVTLTVQPSSSPLVFDATSGAPFGFNPADLPVQGQNNAGELSDFASYTYVQTNTYFGCSGTFTDPVNTCDPGAYAFDFHTNNEPGKPSFNFLPSVNLAPGASTTYLFGTFTPVGTVAEGTYTFYRSGATIVFDGLDATGQNIFKYVTLGETCPAGEEAACAFTRTVVGVPEPQTYALLMAGLLGVGWVARRRRD